MKRSIIPSLGLFFSMAILLSSCGNKGVRKDEKPVDVKQLTTQPITHGPDIKESEITITHPLKADWVEAGHEIYFLKCQACHKLTSEKLVGPGWLDVTHRRSPVWILNMVTNTEMMLDSDAEAQKLLELCLVRMPNQNLMIDDARKVLEFMRNNDGEK